MKKQLILFCLIGFQMMGQNLSKEEFQKNRFDLGISFLLKGKEEKAIQLFHFAHHIIPNNELGCIAFNKYDSLKPIIREKLRRNIIGNWKKIDEGPSWVTPDENGIVGEMITVTENEILFFELYKKAKEWRLVRTEPIVFCKLVEIEKQYIEYEATFREFVYKNKEMWQYNINDETGILEVHHIGYEKDDFIQEIICGGLPTFHYFKIE